jgi:uncharacterized membrane protein YvlD (DUF360 family)
MSLIRDLARTAFRFVVVWVLDIASLLFTAALLPGIGFSDPQNLFTIAAAAAFLLGIVNFIIRPLILLLALPFGFIAIFLIGFFLNAIALAITSQIVTGFYVNTWLDAFLGSLLLAALNTLLTNLIAVDNDDSFYQSLAERLAQREKIFNPDNTQGIVMMEIDGLSYHHIKKAIAAGWMPTLKQMMNEEGYVLSRFDCGLPSQTSACQAGIMFGNNFDIPAFRWYDKTQGKLFVSSRDASEINARFARGNGLMREGSSVNNMLNGDARNSLLTLADLLSGSEEQQQRRAQDVYLVMLNPYFFLRTLVLYCGDVIREVVEGILQQLRREAPRLNRLEHFYPFLRAATTVLMRDISASLTLLQIVRGTPALYVTWPGYDEVAHHSGPWTKDAFRTLRQYDKVIHRVRETIQHKAPRPYELVILSDHGQSYGWTFKQRYGKSLRELIDELTPQETDVMQSAGGDDGIVSVSAMALELDNMQRQHMGGRVGRRVIRNTNRAMQRGIRESKRVDGQTPDTRVVVCGSGNLAQVYFAITSERLTLDALNEMYPHLIDKLVQHEGIGIVMAYNAAGEAIAFGKHGARNVFTNEVTGQDPLTLYGDADLRARQLRHLAEFPHNGDLTIISTVYPDGTVAAMEELVGNHGGMGGEQTDAFLFHPPTFQVPDTSNSAEVFHILNTRRGLVPAPKPTIKPPRQVDAWQPRALWRGMTRVSKWLPLAFRSLLLDRWAYRQAAFDPYMTAPALWIAAVVNFVLMLFARVQVDVVDWGVRMLGWGISVLFAFGAARLLRGKADFTTTLRAMGFAQVAAIVEVLALIPPLALLARVAALILEFLATWLAVNEAHKLRGWRTLALPIAAIGVAVASLIIGSVLLRGIEFSFANVMRLLDLVPR